MSTAVIKSIQFAGSTAEVLAVAEDGNAYRVQTDGTLASLKAALQQATTKASDRKTKPEIFEGMTVDFTPAVPVAVVPTQAEIDRNSFFLADRLVSVLLADQARGYAIDADALAQAQKDAARLYQSSYRVGLV